MRFVLYFTSALVSIFLLWFLLIWGQAGQPTKMSQWIYDVYEKKQNIENNIKGKKVLIVAGSNALFGIDSKMLSKFFKLPVVNYGVNAGIELPLTLYLAKKSIKRGDIVIMPLEYPMYSYDGTAGVQMIDYLLAREAPFFWSLTLPEKLYVIWHTTFERVLEGYFYAENNPVTMGLYGVHHIDKYGDQIQTAKIFQEGYMLQALKNHMKIPEKYGEEYDQNAIGWEYLEKFVVWCKKRNVTIIFMPSTLMRDENYKNSPKEHWLYAHIADEVRKKGWVYVGEPFDYMYDHSDYFNTNFHLNESARLKRTNQMLIDLGKSGF